MKVLLAWELGGALGHVTTLGRTAHCLANRGVETYAALTRLDDVWSWFPRSTRLLPAPRHVSRGPRMSPTTFPDILAGLGWTQPEILGPHVAAWRNLVAAIRPDVVVLDLAPTLLLALRGSGIRTVSFSSPWGNPPLLDPLPAIRSWEAGSKEPIEAVRAREQRLVTTANQVRPKGSAPLTCFADLWTGPELLVKGSPRFDPWAKDRPARYSGPVPAVGRGIRPTWPGGTGPKVFVYLQAAYPHAESILLALQARGVRTLAYLPGAEARTSGSVTIVAEPVHIGAARAEAQLCVTHSVMGTGLAFLAAGVPVVLIPSHLEQLAMARAAMRNKGVVAIPPASMPTAFGPALDLALQESFRNGATATAEHLAQWPDPFERVADLLVS